MRHLSTRQLLLCLALAAAFGHASAAEVRHNTSNESAPQPEAANATQNDRFDDADIDGAVASMHSTQRATPKPKASTSSAPAHTAGDSRTLPARFHSFLPGMFR